MSAPNGNATNGTATNGSAKTKAAFNTDDAFLFE